MDYMCVTTNSSKAAVTMGPFDNNDPWSKVSVSWQSMPTAASYIVKFYTTTSASPSNGTLYQTINTTNSSEVMTFPVVAGTYYYATITGVNLNGSVTAPIPSTGAIQVNPFVVNVRLSGDKKTAVWPPIRGATSYTVKFYTVLTSAPNKYLAGELHQTFNVDKNTPEPVEYAVVSNAIVHVSSDSTVYVSVVGNQPNRTTRTYYSS